MDMQSEVFNFTWPVPDKGFIWDNSLIPAPDCPFLAPLAPGQEGLRSMDQPPFLVANPAGTCRILYRPLEKKGKDDLFVRFTELEPTEDSILAFANKYGMLGIDIALIPATGQGEVSIGESFFLWKRAIIELKAMVHIWEWFRDRDIGKLGQYIIWNKDYSAVLYFPGGAEDIERLHYGGFPQKGAQIIASRHYLAEIFDTWRKGDIVAPTKILLASTINKQLRGAASPFLSINRNGDMVGSIRPINLLSAIWFRFYQAITGERKYRRCKYCHGWMDVTECRSDSDQHPKCGNRARQAKWREEHRKKKGEMSNGKTQGSR